MRLRATVFDSIGFLERPCNNGNLYEGPTGRFCVRGNFAVSKSIDTAIYPWLTMQQVLLAAEKMHSGGDPIGAKIFVLDKIIEMGLLPAEDIAQIPANYKELAKA